MTHVFLLMVYLGAGDTSEILSDDMHFQSIDRCTYFASRIPKTYGNYAYKNRMDKKDYVTAYCIPKKIDSQSAQNITIYK